MAKGTIVLGLIALIIGAGGVGFGAYFFIIFSGQIEVLNEEIADLEEVIADLEDQTNDLDQELADMIANATFTCECPDEDLFTCDSGRILQTRKVSSDTSVDIDDSTLTKTEMLDMNIQITTSGESYLAMRFFTTLMLSLYEGFLRTHFNVSIEFDGEEVSWYHIIAQRSPTYASGENSATSYAVYLEYITPTLVAGTYTVRILWYSIYDEPGAINTLTAHSNGFPSVRTLIVQEIAHCQLLEYVG